MARTQRLQIAAMRERLSLAGDSLTIPVIPQHPRLTPEPVLVKVKAPVYAGPVGSNLAVFDYDRERDRVLPPAIPAKSGAFPDYPIDDPRFHQLNAYAIAGRAIDLVEHELGRILTWGFEASRLIVLPHAGYLANAFYEEDTHSLQLYSFRQLDGTVYHTALIHDVVAHETGHALLDAIRDRYTEGNHRETAAVHEAIGDMSAVFAAFSHEVVRRQFLASAGPDLRGPNLVASIAEEFESSTSGALALRDLARRVDPAVLRATTDPHVLSQQLSGALWEALLRLHAANTRTLDAAEAFRLARTALQRMFVRAFDYLPPADGTFNDFATAMYRADRFANPEDKFGYRAILAGAFADFGIAGSAADLADESSASQPWAPLPAGWPWLTVAEAYVFLDANRSRLALSTQPKYRDFVVRDLQVISRPPQHSDIDAVVMTYEYPVDVKLDRSSGGQLEGLWLPIWGGGTLVFDADGRLRHHAEKPVTRERIQDALRFIATVTGVAVAGTPTSHEERLLVGALRTPYVAAVSGDTVRLRTNPAARGGARAALPGGGT